MNTKPKVKLTDTDGNPLSIIARCARAAGDAGYSKEYKRTYKRDDQR